MRQVRVPLSELVEGEIILRIGNREIESKFRGTKELEAGSVVSGPRGGRHQLTMAGARELVVVLTDRCNPIVLRTSMATVIREVEES